MTNNKGERHQSREKNNSINKSNRCGVQTLRVSLTNMEVTRVLVIRRQSLETVSQVSQLSRTELSSPYLLLLRRQQSTISQRKPKKNLLPNLNKISKSPKPKIAIRKDLQLVLQLRPPLMTRCLMSRTVTCQKLDAR